MMPYSKKVTQKKISPIQDYRKILKTMHEKPLICTAILSDNKKDFLTNVENAKKGGADLAELRIDFLKTIDTTIVNEMILESSLPLIVTIRSKADGGKFPSDKEAERLSILVNSIDAHPAFIDIEFVTQPNERSAVIASAKSSNVGVICSYHEFKKTNKTNEIVAKYKEVCETGADVAKLVYTPHTREEVVNILQAVEIIKDDKIPSTIFGMGDVGQNTRILSPVIGSCLTYCALNPDPKSGLSQLSLKDTKEMFDLLVMKKGWKALRKEHKDVLSAAMGEYLSTYSYPYGMGQIIEQ